MTGGWEPAHVGANFRDDDLSCQVTDAGDAPQQPNRLAKGVEIVLHLGVDFGDGDGECVHLPQMQAQQEAMPLGNASLQGCAQLVGRGLHATVHQSCHRACNSPRKWALKIP